MKRQRFSPVPGLLAVLFILFCHPACMNTPEEEQGNGGNEGFVPHPEGWREAGNHGQFYLAGPASCATSCHGQDLEGGFTEIACTLCHGEFPHPQGWISPTRHGTTASEPGGLDRCAACHGQDFQGGDSGVSCNTCHALYPHREGWIAPSSHGFTALSVGVDASCGTSCHGRDFQGGLSQVSCFTCHPVFPHQASWVDFNNHGAAAKPDPSGTCDSVCHGKYFQGGDSGVSCFACHEPYPHVDWSPFAKHYDWVGAFGDTSCITAQGCHNTFRGPDFGAPLGCTSYCHRTP